MAVENAPDAAAAILGTVGKLPQSTALAEADSGSLTELMSRDPESYSEQDLGNIVAALRADRARREAAAAAGVGRRKPPKAAEVAVPLSIEDLGL